MNRKTINKKICTITLIVFLTLSAVLAVLSSVAPLASAAAAAITLSSSQGVAGSSVNVTGTGFAANTAVGIGFGAEVTISGETVNFAISGVGPYTGIATLARTPIKPGSFSVSLNGNPTTTDDGAGAIIIPPGETNLISGTLNYITGKYTTVTTQNPTGHVVFTVTYTTHGNNVSPAAGITTTASGSFTANITVPNVSNGNYTLTAISAQGNVATSNFTVAAAIPTPTPTATPTPTPSPTPSPTASPTPTPTPVPTLAPTAAPTPAPTAASTPIPTAAPTPTATPTSSPSPSPSPAVPEFSSQLLAITLFISMVLVLCMAIIVKKSRTLSFENVQKNKKKYSVFYSLMKL